jgi:hypothetical protein
MYSQVKAKLASFADTFTLQEAFTKLHTFVLSVAEHVSISETFSALKVYLRSLTDSVSLTEAFKVLKPNVRSFVETFSPADTLTKLAAKVLKETVTVTESFVLRLNGILQWFTKRTKGIQIWGPRTKGSWSATARTKPSNSFWTNRNKP